MQLKLVPPLVIDTATHGEIELLPVVMETGRPSDTPALWLKFLVPSGFRIPVGPREIDKCQRYMSTHGSEALSPDGEIAFTVAGNALIQCSPEVCNPSESEEEVA